MVVYIRTQQRSTEACMKGKISLETGKTNEMQVIKISWKNKRHIEAWNITNITNLQSIQTTPRDHNNVIFI